MSVFAQSIENTLNCLSTIGHCGELLTKNDITLFHYIFVGNGMRREAGPSVSEKWLCNLEDNASFRYLQSVVSNAWTETGSTGSHRVWFEIPLKILCLQLKLRLPIFANMYFTDKCSRNYNDLLKILHCVAAGWFSNVWLKPVTGHGFG